MHIEKSSQNNIQSIADQCLCSACGACASICPKHAIEIKENDAGFLISNVNEDKCVSCRKCLKVCPSNSDNQTIERVEDYYGEYICAYVGYATDPEIRKKSQSGGVVTALLSFLLDSNDIEGAYVNQFDRDSRRPVTVFAKNKNQLFSAMGSCYSQSSVAEAVLADQKINSAAVVLGCQAESIHLAVKNYKTKRPKYLIGLVCAGQNSGLNSEYLIRRSKAYKEIKDISSFRYRSKSLGGWPGDVRIDTSRHSFKVSKDIRQLSKDIFGCYRCKLCFDKANVYSDIVCGDPWGLPEFETALGNTIVLVRTQKGRELIERAQNAGVIYVESLEPDEFFNSTSLEKFVVGKTLGIYRYCSEQMIDIPYTISKELLSKHAIAGPDVIAKLNEAKQFYLLNTKAVENTIAQKDKEITFHLLKMRFQRVKRKVMYYCKRVIKYTVRR